LLHSDTLNFSEIGVPYIFGHLGLLSGSLPLYRFIRLMFIAAFGSFSQTLFQSSWNELWKKPPTS